MSQTPNPDPVLGQPQRGPASSTTDWGKAPPVPEIMQFPQGPQKRSFELGRAVAIVFGTRFKQTHKNNEGRELR